ncbi:type II secretion system minor pseudopilin GspI [Polymorphobacter megasporae]|uniref:type II secretion system minor pseudopilin GspI n=1 Tax=Glacieibacterium megasporae TaxID=2835787 RepID=UPI001C1DD75B|nr:type II secretion system minor pseudopilin GspI [Polymorphobacter megasporae]UAJ10261.1 type II secretion system minor pseudopilin GspI [Polymorphobacter megasporae]
MTEHDTGFTLIEALVAMAVLAVASAGLIRATSAHIDLIRGVEARTIAGWVAENRLVEATLPAAATLPATVTMLGRAWQVTTTAKPSDDPDLAAITVSVTPQGATQPMATLRGFRDARSIAP